MFSSSKYIAKCINISEIIYFSRVWVRDRVRYGTLQKPVIYNSQPRVRGLLSGKPGYQVWARLNISFSLDHVYYMVEFGPGKLCG